MGIDTTIESESHDRTSLDIPGVQHELAAVRNDCYMYFTFNKLSANFLQAVAAVGKTTVLILLNGGTIDMSPELAIIPAVYDPLLMLHVSVHVSQAGWKLAILVSLEAQSSLKQCLAKTNIWVENFPTLRIQRVM